MNPKEISASLGIKGSPERKAMQKRLQAMERDGQIILNRRGGYGLVSLMDLIPGRVVGNAEGFGFLVPDAGGDDIFLSPTVMRSLLHGDRAVVRITGTSRRGKPEGTLIEILERAHEQIVGRYFREKNIGFVVPDNKRLHQDIFIPAGEEHKAKHGQFVVVRLTRQPDKHTQPVGRVIEVIGDDYAPGIATDVALRAYGIPHEWPKSLRKEIKRLDPDNIEIPSGRVDYRDRPFVTIDGEDARDFDDAVYCERHGKGWRLYVAIADVSHYVRPGSALDQEAALRGTSVYFPDRVVPMLPEVLSNELCSLKPAVDRLAMVCEMTVDAAGKVKSSRFHEGVIRSAARLTYTEVAAIVVDRDAGARRTRAAIISHLDELYALYQCMHASRSRRGILDFDTTETRIIFGEAGEIVDIRALVRNDAHRLIEEFMLAANICAADTLEKHNIPVLYRNHTCPKEDRLQGLREFLGAFGLSLGGGEQPDARDYATVLDALQGRPEAALIQTVMLRSLPLAFYGEENLGHFGLAFESYTHFTSPIRRYPDLLVHRALRSLIAGGDYPYDEQRMHQLGLDCSHAERRADEATRDVVQRLKCIYMENRIGEEFHATITGVTGFGLFVQLDEVFVEGLVHVTALPADYYHHDPVHHVLRGERGGLTYRLAGKLQVRLMRVDTEESKIDFELVAPATTARKSGRGKGGKAGRR